MKNQSGDIKIGRHFVIFTADHDSLRLAYDRYMCVYICTGGNELRWTNAISKRVRDPPVKRFTTPSYNYFIIADRKRSGK